MEDHRRVLGFTIQQLHFGMARQYGRRRCGDFSFLKFRSFTTLTAFPFPVLGSRTSTDTPSCAVHSSESCAACELLRSFLKRGDLCVFWGSSGPPLFSWLGGAVCNTTQHPTPATGGTARVSCPLSSPLFMQTTILWLTQVSRCGTCASLSCTRPNLLFSWRSLARPPPL